jgi:hypothetical protein
MKQSSLKQVRVNLLQKDRIRVKFFFAKKGQGYITNPDTNSDS